MVLLFPVLLELTVMIRRLLVQLKVLDVSHPGWNINTKFQYLVKSIMINVNSGLVHEVSDLVYLLLLWKRIWNSKETETLIDVAFLSLYVSHWYYQ